LDLISLGIAQNAKTQHFELACSAHVNKINLICNKKFALPSTKFWFFTLLTQKAKQFQGLQKFNWDL